MIYLFTKNLLQSIFVKTTDGYESSENSPMSSN